MRTSRLTAVLERTLHAKAAQATDPDTTATTPVFDPSRPVPRPGLDQGVRDERDSLLDPGRDGSADPDDDFRIAAPPTRRARPSRRRALLLVPAAACVAAVALAGAVALRGDDAADITVRPLDLGNPPAGWLVPAWVPDGMALWGVDTSSYEQSDSPDPDTIPQLLGDPAGDRAIYVTSHRYEISPDTAEDVAVRGTTGSAGTGWGAAEEELGDAVRWEERGVSITALYRGVTRDAAITALDALEWRSDDPLDGFAPPADDAWPLRAEATSRDTVTHDATLLYSEGVPAVDAQNGQSGLMIYTSSSSTISAGYLETWYLEGSGDGTGPLVTSRDGREVSAHWPDGRSVIVSPMAPESPLTSDVLESIALSATVATAADIASLRDATETRIETLPVVATADTAIGAVDIRADRGFVRLCLRRPGSAGADCDTSALGGSEWADGSATATAQWTVEGSWNFAVASRGEVPRIVDGSDPTVPPSEAGELPAETTVVGDWTVQLVLPPPGVDSICFGSEAAMSCTAARPE
jgi:hypothetical protein